MTASSASPEFDRLLLEAIEIAGRIHDRLADGLWPEGLHWGDAGDMAEAVRALRAVSDRLFAEGEHAPTEVPDIVGYLNATTGRSTRMTTKKTTTDLRRCTGSARFGIEPHEAPIGEFPKQPSRKDGLGTMCTEHWRAYVKGLREARKAAEATDGPEADAA